MTTKAAFEALGSELTRDDVIDVLNRLTVREAHRRLISTDTGEWLYEFKPIVGHQVAYAKVVFREDCIVISFHDDQEGGR